MAHDCEECGQLCYCDMDDRGGLPQPSNCPHITRPGYCPNDPDGPEYDDDFDGQGEG